jgi:CRISPR/Cas system CMR-associated protein Cmr3 (group 5 of RAMP superfamily)
MKRKCKRNNQLFLIFTLLIEKVQQIIFICKKNPLNISKILKKMQRGGIDLKSKLKEENKQKSYTYMYLNL